MVRVRGFGMGMAPILGSFLPWENRVVTTR
jgi:hypothetical protein